MNRVFLRLNIITLLVALLRGAAVAQVPAALAGDWNGELAVPGAPLGVVVRINAAAGQPPAATLDVPAQRLRGLAFSKVEMQADSLVLTSDFLGARYAAKPAPDGQQLVGWWKQNGARWPLTLQRGQPERKRPQDPVPPLPYREQEVRFLNPVSKLNLAGTLTVPPGKGPFPAVVLVTGSGAQDRDESILGHRPFRVLADYLTRRGVAVLRYDDRGTGKSQGDYAAATTDDLLTDAQAALAFLRAQSGVRAKRVGMVGHSEGGTIALLAGAQAQPPAFIVTLAGMGVRGAELLVRQQADVLRAAGLTDTARLGQMRRTQQAVLATVQTTPDNPPAIARVVALLKPVSPGISESALTAMAAQMTGPWYRYFLSLDPRPALARVRAPVLALNGTKDVQVAADLNLPAIEQGLKAGGNRDVTVLALDGLNHLFQTAKTGLPAEYGQLEETFSPSALQLIGNWLAARTTK